MYVCLRVCSCGKKERKKFHQSNFVWWDTSSINEISFFCKNFCSNYTLPTIFEEHLLRFVLNAHEYIGLRYSFNSVTNIQIP